MTLDHPIGTLKRRRLSGRRSLRGIPAADPPNAFQHAALVEAHVGGALYRQTGGRWTSDPTRDGAHLTLTVACCRRRGWLQPLDTRERTRLNRAPHVLTAAGRRAIG